jgi:branched-chain amino acid transport system substrate-binding protein
VFYRRLSDSCMPGIEIRIPSARRISIGRLFVFLALLMAAVPAAAQDAASPVPRIEEAESFFQQGLEAFASGDYGMAERRFRLVYNTFPLNRKTTAAWLMSGKALYRQGEYQPASELLDEFIRTFPTSGYLDEARRTLEFSRNAIAGAARPARNLGVALPLREEDVLITQTIFNGIRLAVDEHNAGLGATPVRIVFRNSEGHAAGAQEAIRSLIREDVDVIIGPLYSSEAIAAAQEARDGEVVLVAPMATDEEVTLDNDFVFQANPTMTMRGRQMAQFATEELNHLNTGIIAQQDASGLAERMAEGFQDESMRLGTQVRFFSLLPNEQAWNRLPIEVGAVPFTGISAVYIPVTGVRAQQMIRNAIAGFDSMGVNVQILGNSEWHGFNAPALAGRYNAVYTHDFYPDESRTGVQDFLNRYTALAGQRPAAGDQRLAFAGYDVTRYLIEKIEEGSDRSMRQVLQQAPLYQGLGIRIHFDGGNVNQGLYFFQYRGGRGELIQ